MPYIQVINNRPSSSPSEAIDWAREFNLLRQELDEMRANYNATLAKLDLDATVTDANYASLNGVAASSVAALAAAPRRFTPT